MFHQSSSPLFFPSGFSNQTLCGECRRNYIFVAGSIPAGIPGYRSSVGRAECFSAPLSPHYFLNNQSLRRMPGGTTSEHAVAGSNPAAALTGGVAQRQSTCHISPNTLSPLLFKNLKLARTHDPPQTKAQAFGSVKLPGGPHPKAYQAGLDSISLRNSFGCYSC